MWTTRILFLTRIILVLTVDPRSEARSTQHDNDTKLIHMSAVLKWPDISNDNKEIDILKFEPEMATTAATTVSTTTAMISRFSVSNSSLEEAKISTTTKVATIAFQRTPSIPRLDEDVFSEQEEEEEEDSNIGELVNERERLHSSQSTNAFLDRAHVPRRNKESWLDRIKSFIKTSTRNILSSHDVQGERQFQEKYGSSNAQPYSSRYGGASGQRNLPAYSPPYSTDYQSSPQYSQGLVPDGAFAPVYKPAASLSLTADFIELNCAANGRIQHGIRWVKLVGLNPYGHHLFATVADGDRVLFDNYHFGVRTDGKNSRLIIRNPDPKIHYGVYQCQASVAGYPSVIIKEDFVVGKVK